MTAISFLRRSLSSICLPGKNLITMFLQSWLGMICEGISSTQKGQVPSSIPVKLIVNASTDTDGIDREDAQYHEFSTTPCESVLGLRNFATHLCIPFYTFYKRMSYHGTIDSPMTCSLNGTFCCCTVKPWSCCVAAAFCRSI